MNAINLKRSLLAAIILAAISGPSMALGVGASATPDVRHRAAQERQDIQDKKDQDARDARRVERDQQDARAAEARARVQRQDFDRQQAMQSQARQAQPMSTAQAQQRAYEQRMPAPGRIDRAAQDRPQLPSGPKDDRFVPPPVNHGDRLAAPPQPQIEPQVQARPADRPQQVGDGHRRDDNQSRQVRQPDRLPEPQRQALINKQRQQAEQFSRQVDSQRATAERFGRTLQQQHRTSQYRYQRDYYDRMRRHQSRHNWRTYNYYNDPYFYTAPSYRYWRAGSYYSINIYGARLIQQAINFGYSEGLRAGEADRYDGWRFDYRSSYAYRDASYGYYGFYVNPSEYNFYFREGFRRGYEDGYYGRRYYGRYYNGANMVLAPVMSLIFNFRLY